MSFVTDMFGGHADTPTINFTPPGFNAGGLNASFGGNGYSVSPGADRSAAVSGMSGAFGNAADEYGNLRQTVAPGFNDLLKARLASINNDASSAIGNLQQNLAARRVLGSSFGSDTLARANNMFSNQRDAAIADNFLKSLQANTQLLGMQTDARRQQFQSALDELNLEANIASNLTTSASSQLAANARTQAQLDSSTSQYNATNNMKTASGLGSFLGTFLV